MAANWTGSSLVSDNGSEFISNTILSWADQNRRMALHCARRASPSPWRADCNTARPHSQIAWPDTGRVRHHLQSATAARAALCERLRASARRSTRPAAHNPRRKRTQSRIEAAQGHLDATHAEVFHFEVVLEPVAGTLPPDAGLLHAAEGCRFRGHAAGVDTHHAIFQCLGHTPDTLQV